MSGQAWTSQRAQAHPVVVGSGKRYCAEAWLVADGILRVVDFDIAGFDN